MLQECRVANVNVKLKEGLDLSVAHVVHFMTNLTTCGSSC